MINSFILSSRGFIKYFFAVWFLALRQRCLSLRRGNFFYLSSLCIGIYMQLFITCGKNGKEKAPRLRRFFKIRILNLDI
ncbi:MAG: hypothetical protein A2008_04955 [Candidatus Wallbacteria bacterium GWC2_49_35]|uniref:Uncharacterized protein n=1 Tax=Candidatus Wallbacteria bacterium GWC2_49_35 TaxID=1817813 RepID=A0A1F7WTM7_9BACT|nr:MAG: hypothetical protein A2008_04955 [Candidatus Wallbacteria bacterium GWC2_49_35]HBC75449.1 hypothetical protein [Candidatus Wallbacteria bacterium]